MEKCRDDLVAITRYVTWNLNEKGSGALSRALPDQADVVSVYRVAVDAAGQGEKKDTADDKKKQAKDNKKVEAKKPAKQKPL